MKIKNTLIRPKLDRPQPANPYRWLCTFNSMTKGESVARVFSKSMVVISFLFIFTGSKGQDIHFSLYEEAGAIINPGLTGTFSGNFRVTTNIKNQWSSMGTPYNTYAAAFDKSISLNSNSSIGVGLHAFRDVAGSTRLSTTDLGLDLSGIVNLNKQQLISLGITGGILQKNIDPNTFHWPDQYQDGSFSPENISEETIRARSVLKFNTSAGLTWQYYSKSRSMVSNDQFRANIGIAYHHANRPEINFLENSDQKLNPKYIMHSNLFIGIKRSRLAVLPTALVALQGPAKEIVAGSMVRLLLQPESKYTKLSKKMACSMGLFYRIGDAIIPTLLFEISSFRIGAAYDITTSSLNRVNAGRGGMEFSLTYVTPTPFSSNKTKRKSLL